MMRRGSRSADGGFTLIETVVVIALTGFVMTVLAATTVVVLRTTPLTTGNIDDARSLRGLSAWLSHDVMSTYAIDVTGVVTDPWSAPSSIFGFDTHPDNPGLCDGASGTNLVQMAWRSVTTSTRVFVASYRFGSDSGEPTVVRTLCEGPTVDSLVVTSRITLTSGLSAAQDFPNVADYDQAGNELTLRLRSDSGTEVVIEATSRNPASP